MVDDVSYYNKVANPGVKPTTPAGPVVPMTNTLAQTVSSTQYSTPTISERILKFFSVIKDKFTLTEAQKKSLKAWWEQHPRLAWPLSVIGGISTVFWVTVIGNWIRLAWKYRKTVGKIAQLSYPRLLDLYQQVENRQKEDPSLAQLFEEVHGLDVNVNTQDKTLFNTLLKQTDEVLRTMEAQIKSKGCTMISVKFEGVDEPSEYNLQQVALPFRLIKKRIEIATKILNQERQKQLAHKGWLWGTWAYGKAAFGGVLMAIVNLLEKLGPEKSIIIKGNDGQPRMTLSPFYRCEYTGKDYIKLPHEPRWLLKKFMCWQDALPLQIDYPQEDIKNKRRLVTL